MKTKISLKFVVVIIIAVTISTFLFTACRMTSTVITPQTKISICKQVEQNPYLGLIEGFQPASGKRMNDLGQRISFAKGICACATSGNHDEHMPIIRQAHKNHQRIYIAGYSTGEGEALSLTEDCEKENIPVEILFLIDGFKKTKIHSTVKHVIDIIGSNPYMFRRSERYQKIDLENQKTTIKYFELNFNHLDIPPNSFTIFSSEITNAQR